MAITKIHAVKSTVGKAIDYIKDANKTAGGSFIYTYGCGAETAALEFEITAEGARGGGENLAYHIVQSFKPGEVTAEQCHEIGKRFAEKVLGGKYQYVLCTHTDREHLHNHIIFNAVSFEDHKRYRSDERSYYRMRDISDDLCREYGIGVVEQERGRRKKHRHQKRPTQKSFFKEHIDDAIIYAKDYDDFIRIMEERGFYVRQDEDLWFRSRTGKRSTRSSSIGRAYTVENIKKRIKGIYRPKNVTLIIDIESNIKIQQSEGYLHWAKIHNMQAAAKSLVKIQEMGISDYDELERMVKERKADLQKSKKGETKNDKRIKEIDEILKYHEIRRKNKPFADKYNKKFIKYFYYNEHRDEIEAFNKADRYLKKKGKVKESELKAERKRLIDERKKAKAKTKEKQAAFDELAALKHNIDMYMGYESYPEDEPKRERQSVREKLRDKQAEVDRQRQRRSTAREEVER